MSERWKPEKGENYWFINFSGAITKDAISLNGNHGMEFDSIMIENGNCFRTRAEAEAAAEKIKELLLSLHEPVTDCNQLPKLTAEVFNRPDCPEWAEYAAVNMYGTGYFYEDEPSYGTENYKGMWYVDTGKVRMMKDAIFNAADWQNSLIERPAKKPELPGLVKVGEWIHSPSDGGCYCKITDIEDDRIFTHSFGDAICFYIKPGDSFSSLRLSQARLRPYNAEEMKALVGKIVKKGRNLYLVTAYIEEQQSIIIASLSSSLFDAELLIVNNMTIDGKPCGVLEHLENGEWVK